MSESENESENDNNNDNDNDKVRYAIYINPRSTCQTRTQMAATAEEDVSALNERIDELSVSTTKDDKTTANKTDGNDVDVTARSCEPRLWGFETRKLYKLALNFYKEKEGKAVHLSYEDKLKLIAFTQQVTHGRCTAENAPPLGVLDMIGRDRRLAWQNLGDISKDQAMEGFIVLLDKLCPLFRTVVEAQKRDFEEKQRLKREEAKKLEEERKFKGLEEERKKQEEERLKEETQRRQIQDALNQQTYYQFKVYAEQQYPGNPEEQGILIRQLQEQHYHQYMQQLRQNQLVIEDQNEKEEEEKEKKIKNVQSENAMCKNDDDDNKDTNENMNDEDSDDLEDWPPITPAEMWTRKGVEEFKQIIRRETGDAVIKVGHGETVTVRVPTHEDGTCLFWEFATDGYDIGFGVYFEWSKPETNQVSVYISESEEDEEEEEYEPREDLESGSVNGNVRPERKTTTPPISVIVPIYRRDSQEEIYAGSHQYPGEGVYLLKFDNSYSLWRSKTLYYRVYYTRQGFTKNNN